MTVDKKVFVTSFVSVIIFCFFALNVTSNPERISPELRFLQAACEKPLLFNSILNQDAERSLDGDFVRVAIVFYDSPTLVDLSSLEDLGVRFNRINGTDMVLV